MVRGCVCSPVESTATCSKSTRTRSSMRRCTAMLPGSSTILAIRTATQRWVPYLHNRASRRSPTQAVQTQSNEGNFLTVAVNGIFSASRSSARSTLSSTRRSGYESGKNSRTTTNSPKKRSKFRARAVHESAAGTSTKPPELSAENRAGLPQWKADFYKFLSKTWELLLGVGNGQG